jgi:hypothetical protein
MQFKQQMMKNLKVPELVVEVINPRRNLDDESLPSDTSEHCHLADRNGTLLGHLDVEREIVPNPSMFSKNRVADKLKWNFCNLSKDDFVLRIDEQHKLSLQRAILRGSRRNLAEDEKLAPGFILFKEEAKEEENQEYDEEESNVSKVLS